MSVVVDVRTVSESGAQIKAAARGLPDPVAVPAGSAGSTVVDESVHDFLTSFGQCVVGGATVIYTLGQDAQGAAASFDETDQSLRAGTA